jgi:acyl dehydratase
MPSLYYEDIEIGQTFVSGGRTITESDNTFHCMATGDWNPIHCNEEYAKATPYGQRIVGGLFGLSLITGAMTQWGVFEASAIGMLNIRDWAFKAPIFIGDTITITMSFAGKRLTSRGDRGIVQRHFVLSNQRGAIAQEGDCDMMIARRPDQKQENSA